MAPASSAATPARSRSPARSARTKAAGGWSKRSPRYAASASAGSTPSVSAVRNVRMAARARWPLVSAARRRHAENPSTPRATRTHGSSAATHACQAGDGWRRNAGPDRSGRSKMSSTPGVTSRASAEGSTASVSPSASASTCSGRAGVVTSMNRSTPGVVSKKFQAIGGTASSSADSGARS